MTNDKTSWTCPDCCVNPCNCRVYQPMTNDSELLPCPFCGEEDADVVSGVSYGVKCHQCYAKVHCCDSRELAIKQWNTRTQFTGGVSQETIGTKDTDKVPDSSASFPTKSPEQMVEDAATAIAKTVLREEPDHMLASIKLTYSVEKYKSAAKAALIAAGVIKVEL